MATFINLPVIKPEDRLPLEMVGLTTQTVTRLNGAFTNTVIFENSEDRIDRLFIQSSFANTQSIVILLGSNEAIYSAMIELVPGGYWEGESLNFIDRIAVAPTRSEALGLEDGEWKFSASMWLPMRP